MIRRAQRRDANEPDIVNALRAIGASVELLPGGGGRPDLAVGWRGATYLLEVKDPKQGKSGGRQRRAARQGGLDDDQAAWHAAWRGHVAVVETENDALRAVGAIS